MATQVFLECSPWKLGKMNPFWRAYFSKGLVQPPTSNSSIATYLVWGPLGLGPIQFLMEMRVGWWLIGKIKQRCWWISNYTANWAVGHPSGFKEVLGITWPRYLDIKSRSCWNPVPQIEWLLNDPVLIRWWGNEWFHGNPSYPPQSYPHQK